MRLPVIQSLPMLGAILAGVQANQYPHHTTTPNCTATPTSELVQGFSSQSTFFDPYCQTALGLVNYTTTTITITNVQATQSTATAVAAASSSVSAFNRIMHGYKAGFPYKDVCSCYASNKTLARTTVTRTVTSTISSIPSPTFCSASFIGLSTSTSNPANTSFTIQLPSCAFNNATVTVDGKVFNVTRNGTSFVFPVGIPIAGHVEIKISGLNSFGSPQFYEGRFWFGTVGLQVIVVPPNTVASTTPPTPYNSTNRVINLKLAGDCGDGLYGTTDSNGVAVFNNLPAGFFGSVMTVGGFQSGFGYNATELDSTTTTVYCILYGYDNSPELAINSITNSSWSGINSPGGNSSYTSVTSDSLRTLQCRAVTFGLNLGQSVSLEYVFRTTELSSTNGVYPDPFAMMMGCEDGSNTYQTGTVYTFYPFGYSIPATGDTDQTYNSTALEIFLTNTYNTQRRLRCTAVMCVRNAGDNQWPSYITSSQPLAIPPPVCGTCSSTNDTDGNCQSVCSAPPNGTCVFYDYCWGKVSNGTWNNNTNPDCAFTNSGVNLMRDLASSLQMNQTNYTQSANNYLTNVSQCFQKSIAPSLPQIGCPGDCAALASSVSTAISSCWGVSTACNLTSQDYSSMAPFMSQVISTIWSNRSTPLSQCRSNISSTLTAFANNPNTDPSAANQARAAAVLFNYPLPPPVSTISAISPSSSTSASSSSSSSGSSSSSSPTLVSTVASTPSSIATSATRTPVARYV